MIKRLFDIFFSAFLLILLAPLFLFIAISVMIDSKGGVFFAQQRVGKGEKPFKLWKFRTMRPQSEALGQLTVGDRDNRITSVGYHLRKYKVDELPQLWNVFIGDMSIVGPRPEVPRYVAMYNAEQKKVFQIRPGITDYASILYFKESELLAKASDPEEVYIQEIMPAKIKLNLEYLNKNDFFSDLKIIVSTVGRMFS
jgi:lipopolysaccharide/colanic/teichoic acid biosynthesis glycosyltransferase